MIMTRILWDLNDLITRGEILKSVEQAKLRKAAGYDEIPTEVIKINKKLTYYTLSVVAKFLNSGHLV